MASQQPGKIFIGGMPYSYDENTLKGHFEKFGTVTDSKLFIVIQVQEKQNVPSPDGIYRHSMWWNFNLLVGIF